MRMYPTLGLQGTHNHTWLFTPCSHLLSTEATGMHSHTHLILDLSPGGLNLSPQACSLSALTCWATSPPPKSIPEQRKMDKKNQSFWKRTKETDQEQATRQTPSAVPMRQMPWFALFHSVFSTQWKTVFAVFPFTDRKTKPAMVSQLVCCQDFHPSSSWVST